MSNIRRALDASRRGLARARDRRLARKTPRGTTTAWIGWLIRKMLEVAVTVAGLLAFLELYFSEPAIDHGELDAAEPFSMPFTIANPHYFPLPVVERRCIVTMTYPNRLEANQQWAFQRD